MIKNINNYVQTSINSNQLVGVYLVYLDFDTTIYRYCNAYQSVYWDEEGSGEVEYVGVGHLGTISTITETTELEAQTIQVSISGIPNEHITNVFSNDYINKPMYIWFATLDEDTYAVEGGQYGPVLIFAGLMDFGAIEFGKTSTITINSTSRLGDWERPRGGRFNHNYQIQYIDPTDKGFTYVEALQNAPIAWGGITVSDPGTSNSGGRRRGQGQDDRGSGREQ